jgi:hypothetical protein
MRKLTPELHKAVNETISDKYRDEAFEILFLTTEAERKHFIEAYEKDRGNICCLVLDYAKRDLARRNILKINEDDGFGHFPFE